MKLSNSNNDNNGIGKPEEKENDSCPFYRKNWFIILSLFFFAPLGIILMYRQKKWKKSSKIIAAVLSLLWFALVIFIDPPASYSDDYISDTQSPFISELSDTARETRYSQSESRYTHQDYSESSETESNQPVYSPLPDNTPSRRQPPTTEKETETEKPKIPTGEKYVLNTNTKVYHRPTCRYVEKIKPENYQASSSVPSEYRPCKVCNP